jgi:hypothetical protein
MRDIHAQVHARGALVLPESKVSVRYKDLVTGGVELHICGSFLSYTTAKRLERS